MAKRNNYAMIGAQLLGASISATIGLVGSIIRSTDQARRDNSMIERREYLNRNTLSIMQSRQTMDELRLARLQNAALERLIKQAQLEKIKEEKALIVARTAALNAMHNASGNDAEQIGAVFSYCPECKGQQSVYLGSTCLTCGGTKLQRKHLEVRN